MKRTVNMTTCGEDLDRFSGREDFLNFIEGLDGVELTFLGEDEKDIIPKEKVLGLHLCYFPYWVDFWLGDMDACMKEFGSREVMEAYYGGGRDAFLQRFRDDIAAAKRYGVEYMVFHTTDAAVEETFTRRYHNSSERVIDALCSLVNELFGEGEEDSPLLLLENLWQPGFTFTDPELTARMLEGIKYKNRGIMLDTGHLMHTDPELESQDEAIDYIHLMLDCHGELCKKIYGMHLQQSLTGQYAKKLMADPPKLAKDYAERAGEMFMYAFSLDKHMPFTTPRVKELTERIAPRYLTYEFISRSREELGEYIRIQSEMLK